VIQGKADKVKTEWGLLVRRALDHNIHGRKEGETSEKSECKKKGGSLTLPGQLHDGQEEREGRAESTSAYFRVDLASQPPRGGGDGKIGLARNRKKRGGGCFLEGWVPGFPESKGKNPHERISFSREGKSKEWSGIKRRPPPTTLKSQGETLLKGENYY